VHFSLKICNLVATILVIFHWGNFSKVVCFSHMRNFSQFKGVHGQSGPMVNTPMLTTRNTRRYCHQQQKPTSTHRHDVVMLYRPKQKIEQISHSHIMTIDNNYEQHDTLMCRLYLVHSPMFAHSSGVARIISLESSERCVGIIS